MSKREFTADDWRRMEGLADAYEKALEAMEVIARAGTQEVNGVRRLTMTRRVLGPSVIHQAATRYRLSVILRLAFNLDSFREGFEELAEGLNDLLSEPVDLDQDYGSGGEARLDRLIEELVGEGTLEELGRRLAGVA